MDRKSSGWEAPGVATALRLANRDATPQNCVFEMIDMRLPTVAKAQPWAEISERFQRCFWRAVSCNRFGIRRLVAAVLRTVAATGPRNLNDYGDRSPVTKALNRLAQSKEKQIESGKQTANKAVVKEI
jgi:hypothetical protein